MSANFTLVIYPQTGAWPQFGLVAECGAHRKMIRVQRLMGVMGLEVIYQRSHTSRPAPEHRI